MVLDRFGQLRDGDWGSLGTYKFVVGRSPTAGGWDCTSPNPGAHWTLGNETYCWQDYLAILDALGAQRPEVVDPATVAERWGRVPAVTVEGVQVAAQALAGAAVPVRFTALESGAHWLLAGGSCQGGGRLLAAGRHLSGTQAVVNVPAGSLPRGVVGLQLCVQNAFGRLSAVPLRLTVT
jgi:hypothetical protein